MKTQKHSFVCGSALAMILAIGAYPAHAQVTGNASPAQAPGQADPGAQASEQGGLQDIIVTARKTSENLMNVPIAITAVSGSTLAASGITSLDQVDTSIPSLFVLKSGVTSGVGIRGLFTALQNYSADSSVGISEDEVFLNNARFLNAAQFDLDQLEVLKGPQGTYFGKNTTAGLLNITTKGPTSKLEGYLRASYEFAEREKLIEGAIGGPLTSTFGARLALHYENSDGFLYDDQLNKREPGRRSFIGRLSLAWRPTDTLRFSYKLQREETHQTGAYQEVSACSAAALAVIQAFNVKEDCVFNRHTSNATSTPGFVYQFNQGFYDDKSWIHAFRGSLDLGDFSLTSVTGYVDLDYTVAVPISFFGLPHASIRKDETLRTFSEEVRLQSPDIGPLKFIVGGYYANSDYTTHDTQGYYEALYSATFLTSFSRAKIFTQTNKTEALFGEFTLSATDRLKLTLGGRYTHDTKAVTIFQSLGSLGNPYDGNPTGANLFGYNNIPLTGGYRSVNNFSPAVTLNYQFPAGIVYASFKKGFKSGGFDSSVGSTARLLPTPTDPDSAFEYEDEKAKSYEIGAKLNLLDHHLRVTAALFRTEFSDLQLTALAGTIPIFLNAANARAQGVDFDATYALDRNLTANFSLGYVNSTYGSFPNAQCYPGQTVAQGCVGGVANLTGRTQAYAPKLSLDGGLDWQHHVANGLLFTLGGDVSYRSSHYLNVNLSPLSFQTPYALFNAHASFGSADDKWKVTLVGRNLFDRDYAVGASDVPFFAGTMTKFHGMPRTVQIIVSTTF